MVDSTGIHDVAAADSSRPQLAAASARVSCPTYLASVLDPYLSRRIPQRFDVVLLVAVLHHLVGRTRRRSYELADQALAGALSLVEPHGHLVVHEPTFSTRAAMWGVFYLKRAVTTVTSRRVTFLSCWNNIGAPVVSFFTVQQLHDLVARHGRIVATDVADRPVHPLLRACGIRRRCDTTLILQRPAN